MCAGFKKEDGKEISYIGSRFERIVPGMFVQGGKIKGDGPLSIFPQGEFADESFKVKHTEPGLLGMCQRNGYKNTNECQFYVTTCAPLTFMDYKNVIFGRVIQGMRTFKMIEKIECQNEVPLCDIAIKAAGIYKGE